MPFEPTPEQQSILNHDPTRHARVLAGPGTGKSTTMVALLDRLLKENNSLRVRMLTFTRAATGELAEKVAAHCAEAERPNTIHSFAISILLRNPGTGGFPEPLRIPDTWEFKNVVRPTLARRSGVSQRWKNSFMKWRRIGNRSQMTPIRRSGRRIVSGLEERGTSTVVYLAYTLLQELPYALRRALRDHDDLDGISFDLLLVDEYQDLNACDLDVLKLLSTKGGCAVVGTGDDDQSIYSWRKAAPEGIRRFLEDYGDAKDYSLSVTMRCGKKIIEWANYVIEADPDRPRNRACLNPLPNSPKGEVALLFFRGERSEAKGIAQLIRGLMDEGIKPNEILVLMRTDHNRTFSKPTRECLQDLNIPFSDPSHVLALLAEENNRRLLELLHLVVNPNDSIAWASLIYLTPRVGENFFDYVYLRAKEKGITFATELQYAYGEVFPGGPASAARVKELMQVMFTWLKQTHVPDETPEQGWGSWIIELSRKDDFVPTPTAEFQQLLQGVDGLAKHGISLERYLGQIEPLGKDLAQALSDSVRIMTMGGSKGLTVRAVIIAGVEDGLIPRPESDLSEERRILYVAMTRATEYLFCTWAGRRHGPTARAGYSSMNRRRHSHFLDNGPVESQDGQAFLDNRF